MSRNYERILRAVANTPWAIEPKRGAQIMEFFRLKAEGIVLERYEIEAIVQENEQSNLRRTDAGSVAVLTIAGVIAHRAEQVDDISGPGGTSTEKLGQRFDQAVDDPNVSAILFDIRSPGGSVDGVPELATKIRNARGSKPIVASANAFAASAAYWLAVSADELVVTPSGEVGSIGVYTAHQDFSQAFELEGVKTTLIHAGKFKVEANPFEPLTDEAHEALQSRVDDFHAMFINDVAKGRGVKASEVRSGFGEGRMVGAREAVQLGMADRVETFEATLARIHKPNKRKGRSADSARRRLSLT